MKKITIACMLAAALVLSACGNNASKKKDAQTKTTETSQQEQYLTEDLIIKLDSLISGSKTGYDASYAGHDRR